MTIGEVIEIGKASDTIERESTKPRTSAAVFGSILKFA